MVWAIHYNDNHSLLEISLSGNTSMEELKNMTSQAISDSKSRDITRILVDTTGILLTFDTSELVNLPAGQYVIEDARRDSYVALILPVKHKEKNMARFYESACTSRGWGVKSFTERETAMAWLDQVAPLRSVNN